LFDEVIILIKNYFKDASEQFYYNSKLYDEKKEVQIEKLYTFSGLFNLAEGLKKLQEDINTIAIQLELIENKMKINNLKK
jgi:hypothetical protein